MTRLATSPLASRTTQELRPAQLPAGVEVLGSPREAGPLLAQRLRGTLGGALRAVGIGEMIATSQPGEILVAYALGSCVALTLHDPVAGAAGLLHSPQPSARVDPERASQRPAMFVDTAIPALIRKLENLGARKERLVARVAGAGQPFDDRGLFQTGKRNYAAVRNTLWKNDLALSGSLVGGRPPRTLFHLVAEGQTLVRTEGEVYIL